MLRAAPSKLGGTSEAKIKNYVFYFVFRSVCTMLRAAPSKLGGTSEAKIKNYVFYFVLRSVCTNFAGILKAMKNYASYHLGRRHGAAVGRIHA